MEATTGVNGVFKANAGLVVEFASDAARANAFVMFYLTKCDTGKAAIRRLRLRCSTNDVLKPPVC